MIPGAQGQAGPRRRFAERFRGAGIVALKSASPPG
jgi:hypothetical protein